MKKSESNQLVEDSILTREHLFVRSQHSASYMTMQGVMNKLFLALLSAFFGATIVWYQYASIFSLSKKDAVESLEHLFAIAIGFSVITLPIAFFINPQRATYLTLPYAFCEGIALCAISLFIEYKFQLSGIALQALLATASVIFALIFMHWSGVLRMTQKDRKKVFTVFTAYTFFSLFLFVLNFFKVGTAMGNIVFGFDSSPVSIVFSLGVLVLASLVLLSKISLLEEAASLQAPKYMEWYGAYGLMAVIFWMYVLVLKLLIKTRRRQRR